MVWGVGGWGGSTVPAVRAEIQVMVEEPLSLTDFTPNR